MFLSRPFKEDIFSYSRKSNNLENWPTQFFLSCFSAILQLGWVWGPRAISPAAGVWRSFPPPHHPLQGGLSGPRDGQRVMSKLGWIVCKQLFIQFCGKLHAIFVTTWCYVLLSFFYSTVLAVWSAAPQTALWGGSGPRFELWMGGLEAGTTRPSYPLLDHHPLYYKGHTFFKFVL